MVKAARTAHGAGAIRPINAPRTIGVETDVHGLPRGIRTRKGPQEVRSILDTWRIDDEWWREKPVSRIYHSVLLDDGRTVTIFHDLATDRWYGQSYA